MLSAWKSRRPKIFAVNPCDVIETDGARQIRMQEQCGMMLHRSGFEIIARLLRLGKQVQLSIRKLRVQRSLVTLSVANWPSSEFSNDNFCFWPPLVKKSTTASSSTTSAGPTCDGNSLLHTITAGFDSLFAEKQKKVSAVLAEFDIESETQSDASMDSELVKEAKKGSKAFAKAMCLFVMIPCWFMRRVVKGTWGNVLWLYGHVLLPSDVSNFPAKAILYSEAHDQAQLSVAHVF